MAKRVARHFTIKWAVKTSVKCFGITDNIEAITVANLLKYTQRLLQALSAMVQNLTQVVGGAQLLAADNVTAGRS